MKVKVEASIFTVTLRMSPMEADLLQGRAELAHEKFEGGGTNDHNVMEQLAKALKRALAGATVSEE